MYRLTNLDKNETITIDGDKCPEFIQNFKKSLETGHCPTECGVCPIIGKCSDSKWGADGKHPFVNKVPLRLEKSLKIWELERFKTYICSKGKFEVSISPEGTFKQRVGPAYGWDDVNLTKTWLDKELYELKRDLTFVDIEVGSLLRDTNGVSRTVIAFYDNHVVLWDKKNVMSVSFTEDKIKDWLVEEL